MAVDALGTVNPKFSSCEACGDDDAHAGSWRISQESAKVGQCGQISRPFNAGAESTFFLKCTCDTNSVLHIANEGVLSEAQCGLSVSL